MKSGRVIRSERLTLREIRQEDTALIVELRSDPETYRYFKNPHCLTAEEHERWYREIYLRNPEMVNWICEKDGVGIGVFAAKRLSDAEAEVSYLVSGRYRRMGYAKESLWAVMAWVWQEWNPARITAEIHEDNTASAEFIKSAGFHEAGRKKVFLKYVKDFEET